jgi:hypothetical protein
MAMPAHGTRDYSVVAQVLVGSFASMALVWAVFAVPVFWREAPLESIAKRIIAEDSFNIDSLTSIKATFVDLEMAQAARPSTLSAGAIINLRLLEQAIARGDQKNLDGLMKETSEMIGRSLVNSPADPFLWMVLFWLENTRSGFKSAHLEFLKMSYLVGANEGWVAVRRNRFALAIYPSLPIGLAENAVAEFSRLVGSSYMDAAADIMEGPGWPIRDGLISGLKEVDEVQRQSFDKLIYRRGLDLAVPGVERPEWRPWH